MSLIETDAKKAQNWCCKLEKMLSFSLSFPSPAPTYKMPPRSLTKEERIWIVKAYARYKEERGEVRRNWPFVTPRPARNTIVAIASKFDVTGEVKDKNRSGRPKSMRTNANINAISQSIQVNNQTSVRRLAVEHTLKKSTVHGILRKDLKLKSFRPVEVFALKPGDYELRYNQTPKQPTS